MSFLFKEQSEAKAREKGEQSRRKEGLSIEIKKIKLCDKCEEWEKKSNEGMCKDGLTDKSMSQYFR